MSATTLNSADSCQLSTNHIDCAARFPKKKTKQKFKKKKKKRGQFFKNLHYGTEQDPKKMGSSYFQMYYSQK